MAGTSTPKNPVRTELWNPTFRKPRNAGHRSLDVVRYDAESLHNEFGVRFHLLDSSKELHQTPFGTLQQFLYASAEWSEVIKHSTGINASPAI